MEQVKNSNFSNLDNFDLEPIQGEIEIDDVVVVDEDLENLRIKVKESWNQVQAAFWFLGESLCRISSDKLYKAWGYKTFNDYLDHDCSHARSSAYSLMKTYRYYQQQLKEQLPQSEIYETVVTTAKQVGWSKASKLAQEQVVNEKNYTEVVEAMVTLTVPELENKLRMIKASMTEDEQQEIDDNNTVKTVKKSYQFNLFQADVVDKAIEKAKGMLREGASDSRALAFICGDFDSSNAPLDTKNDIADYFSKIERTTEFNLIVVSKNYKKVLYGADVLKKLAESGDND